MIKTSYVGIEMPHNYMYLTSFIAFWRVSIFEFMLKQKLQQFPLKIGRQVC